MTITMREFKKKYCSDLIERAKELANSEFITKDYDDIIEDDYGDPVKVLYAGGETINLDDMFGMDDADYAATYKSQEALELRKKYLSQFVIIEGLDILNYVSKQMEDELAKINRSYELQKEFENDNSQPDEEGSAVSRALYSGRW